jgi:hypothetical protein
MGQRVQSQVYRDRVIWLMYDDATGGWRYNVARRDGHGEPIDGPGATKTFGPFLSLTAASRDAAIRVLSLTVDRIG